MLMRCEIICQIINYQVPKSRCTVDSSTVLQVWESLLESQAEQLVDNPFGHLKQTQHLNHSFN